MIYAEIIKKKMELGKINDTEIGSMKKLSIASQVHFFEEYNLKNGVTDEIKNQIDQLEMILLNEAAEARTETARDDGPYGTEMIKAIENRLATLSVNKQQDIFYKKYEILKGIIGMLVSDCQIWFSNNTQRDLN